MWITIHVHLNKMSLSWSTCGWLNLARLGSNFCGLTSRYIIILPLKKMTISGDHLRMNQSHVKLCRRWLFYCSDKCKHKKLIIKSWLNSLEMNNYHWTMTTNTYNWISNWAVFIFQFPYLWLNRSIPYMWRTRSCFKL